MSHFQFPQGFAWGTATSSYQIEGATRVDDRGESIWDRFCHSPGHVANGDVADVACDHYHRFEEDIALMSEIGVTHYRFSIAWPRILPDGKGSVNKRGLAFYDRLIDSLLEAGITPMPTLYHWDLPESLERAGGWPERQMVSIFADYAEIVARALGDRIDSWIIFNEPFVFTLMGYFTGEHAPGVKNFGAFLRASHVVNLAQAEAFRAIRSERPRAQIGTALNMAPCDPYTDDPSDAEAAERHHKFTNLWFLDPALRGHYPEAFIEGVPFRTMGVERDDLQKCLTPFDFLGINLYTRARISADASNPALGSREVNRPEGPVTDMGWEVWPEALHSMIMRITQDYDQPKILITENGCAYDDEPNARGAICDNRRIDYMQGHLQSVARAIEDGADVGGYYAWSLLDNFEWAYGYDKRFGMIHVDFETCRRTLKDSARWYSKVVREGRIET